MNPAERFELDSIRQDQATVHRAVESLDRRIEILTRSVSISTSLARVEQRDLQSKATAPPIVAAQVEQKEPPIPASPRPSGEPAMQRAGIPAKPVLPPPLPKAAAPPPPAVPPTETPDASEPLELRVGTYWMARIGILILLTGLVFLGNYAYQRWVALLGPGGKLALLTLAGVGLGGLGVWMERSRESLKNFGRVLIAGGAATIYYTAYAAHFVERLKVIDSPILGGALLLALAGGIVWFAERRKSEAIALPAILLSYYTAAINPAGSFTLFSNLLLTAAAVFFLVRHRWTGLSFASLVATYGSYTFWRFHQLAEVGALSQYGVGFIYLASYWILFTAAVLLVAPGAMKAVQRTAFLTVNNAAYLILASHHFAVHRPGSFWLFASAYGTVLLGLAALSARRFPDEPAMDGSYLAQGLALLTVGLAAKLTGPQLSVFFAIESLALHACTRLRHGWLYETAATICAFGAFGFGLENICTSAEPLKHGIAVTALLLGGTWWTKHLRSDVRIISPRSVVFAVLGFILLGTMLWRQTPFAWQPSVLALAALAALPAQRVRLAELTLTAQAFVPLAALAVVVRCGEAAPEPWWSPMPVVIAALVLVHWWQFANQEEASKVSEPLSALFAWVAVGTSAIWMSTFLHGEQWLVPASIAALVTLVYGLATRAWMISLAGQVFTLIAVCQFAVGLAVGHPHWAAALAPIVAIALTGPTVALFGNYRWPSMAFGDIHASVGLVCRVLTGVMLAAWSLEYVPADWRVVFFAGVGALQILAGSFFQNRNRIVVGALYGTAGFLFFIVQWTVPQFIQAVTLTNLLAIVAIPASLRWGARLAREAALPEEARQGLTTGALVCVWLWVTRWTHLHGWDGQLTTMWALLAVAVLLAGLGLRDRVYRLGGFVILGCTLGRLFFVDVWRFDTLYRIVSFLVLGVALLGLSFVYNRFADTMKRWL